jgi:hypothetical protein
MVIAVVAIAVVAIAVVAIELPVLLAALVKR